MKQIARELTNFEDGFLNGKRYLIMDRDAKFCASFRDILDGEDVEPLRLPPQSPNLNAHLERFFGSLKTECLSRMIFFGERSLRRVSPNSWIIITLKETTKDSITRSSSQTRPLAAQLDRSSAAND